MTFTMEGVHAYCVCVDPENPGCSPAGRWSHSPAAGIAVWTGHCGPTQGTAWSNTPLLPLAGRIVCLCCMALAVLFPISLSVPPQSKRFQKTTGIVLQWSFLFIYSLHNSSAGSVKLDKGAVSPEEVPHPFIFNCSSLCYLQDWALGVLHAKIIAAITLMGPQWWLKTVIEQVDLFDTHFNI